MKTVSDPAHGKTVINGGVSVTYTFALKYATGREREKRSARFYRSTDGTNYQALIPEVNLDRGVGEDVILFLADDSAPIGCNISTGSAASSTFLPMLFSLETGKKE